MNECLTFRRTENVQKLPIHLAAQLRCNQRIKVGPVIEVLDVCVEYLLVLSLTEFYFALR